MRIEPFRALRPENGLADKISCPPYDVVDTEEARRLAAENPLCFLRVTRPEIQFPAGTDPHSDAVYERARKTFSEFRQQGWMIRESEPSLYLVRQIQSDHQQIGVVARCSIEDYESGVIRRHEHTRPVAEADRARHIEALGAQPGPVMLAYRGQAEITERMAAAATGEPLYDLRAPDGVRHTAWRIPDPTGF
ncbi:MAG: DUF1015 domain-containing protein, partial [Kiritimatiellia bacterium]|nr:DUF1015 domain-containing protein [Kiritimatiellia bacterium]